MESNRPSKIEELRREQAEVKNELEQLGARCARMDTELRKLSVETVLEEEMTPTGESIPTGNVQEHSPTPHPQLYHACLSLVFFTTGSRKQSVSSSDNKVLFRGRKFHPLFGFCSAEK